jgi:hypothetical protein
LKEELLEEVVARIKGGECLCDLEELAVSESEEDAEDLRGDGSSREAEADTRSYGLFVRRIIGALLSIFPFAAESSFVFLGSVRAQFSHGIALFLSFSS